MDTPKTMGPYAADGQAPLCGVIYPGGLTSIGGRPMPSAHLADQRDPPFVAKSIVCKNWYQLSPPLFLEIKQIQVYSGDAEDEPYPVQAAIDRAMPGDTVQINPGVVSESSTLSAHQRALLLLLL